MGYLLPVVSGILLTLSFPKAAIGLLAWVALIPLFYSIRDKGPRQSFIQGLVAGLAYYLTSIYWVINTMHNYGGLPYAASLLLLGALAAYMALYIGAFAWLVSLVCRKGGIPLVVFAPVAWVSLELLRNYLFSGFPWDQLGYSQAGFLRVIQVSDITGVYGVSALIVLVNAALADLVVLRMKGSRHSLTRLAGPVAAFAVLACALAYGQYRLSHPPQSTGSLKVALVQGNIEQFHKWDPAYQDEVTNDYIKLTLKAASEKPDLIIWPETATPYYYDELDKRARLEEAVRVSCTPLLTGSPSSKKLDDGSYVDYNSAYLLDAKGITVGRYDKMHLVPFGEYVPLKKLLPFVSKVVEGIGDFGAGTDYTVLDSGKGRFGTAICFEVIFPELVRMFPLRGAEFLVSITNDAWFGESAAPYQHFNMSVFRAVENRRALVRAANTGITGIILPSGEVASRTSLFTRLYLMGDVPLVQEKSFYTMHGDLFAYGCVLLTAILAGIAVGRKRSISIR